MRISKKAKNRKKEKVRKKIKKALDKQKRVCYNSPCCGRDSPSLTPRTLV